MNAYGTRIAKILPGCLTLVLFSQPAAPQANNKSAQDGSVKIEVNVNDVLVPVVVRKAQGRGVGDLKKEDFRVFDQGQLKVISGFKVQTRSAAWDGRQDAESTSSDAHLVVPGVLPPAAAQTQTHQAMSVPLQVAEISQATSPPVNETPPSSASPPTSLDSRSPKNKAAEIPQATSGQSAAPAPNRPVRLIPRSSEDRQRATQAGHHIILNVFVADASGNPVAGLNEEDFTLFENQEPHKIASFKAVTGGMATAPFHVMLMLDSLNNSSGTLAYEHKEFEKFLARNQGRLTYPFSIVRLTDFGISASHPSRDGNVLIGELRMLPNDAHVMSRDQGSSGNVVAFGPTLNPSEGMSLPNPAAQDLNQRFMLSMRQLTTWRRNRRTSPAELSSSGLALAGRHCPVPSFSRTRERCRGVSSPTSWICRPTCEKLR